MDINTMLQNLSPLLVERLHNDEIKLVAESTGYNIHVVRRMLAGNAERYGYKNESVARVVENAIEVMKLRDGIEKLEASLKPFIEAA